MKSISYKGCYEAIEAYAKENDVELDWLRDRMAN